MDRPFTDRRDAGRRLAPLLDAYAGRADVVVLALPRGGVPVAYEVARALAVELDVLPVCKLGVPWQPELAIGALSSGDAQYVDTELADRVGMSEQQMADVMAAARAELARREARYRGERAAASVGGRVAIIVDDGMATGASLKAAARALAVRGPSRIVAALPVAPVEARARLGSAIDELVCVQMPAHFYSVGQFYLDFDQTGDAQVSELLARAQQEHAGERNEG